MEKTFNNLNKKILRILKNIEKFFFSESKTVVIVFIGIGILLRLLLMYFFIGGDFDSMFKFVTYSITESDPWQYILDNNIWSPGGNYPPPFPYPALTLYILKAFRYLTWNLNSSVKVTGLDALIFKMPLLLADLALLWLLLKRFSKQKVLVSFFWSFNILLLINSFFIGHIDILPAFLLVLALYFLEKDKILYSSISLAFGVAIKSFPLFALPIIWFKKSKKIIEKVIGTLIVFLLPKLFELSFRDSYGYRSIVSEFSEKYRILLTVFPMNLGNTYIMVMILALVVIVLYLVTRVSKNEVDSLVLIFSTLLIFSVPQFNWYAWIVPLLMYQILSHKEKIWRMLRMYGFMMVWLAYISLYTYSPVFNPINKAMGTELTLIQFQTYFIEKIPFLTPMVLENVLFSLMTGFLLYSFVETITLISNSRKE